jgi:Beta-glucan synthesis-associated protein SKN1/KRE6/Sbg1
MYRLFTGFEYWANPSNPPEGFITWMVDDQESARLGAASVGPDQGPNGTGVGQRLIPEEPMSIVLNLGISRKFSSSSPLSSVCADVCCRKLADDRPDDYDVPGRDVG